MTSKRDKIIMIIGMLLLIAVAVFSALWINKSIQSYNSAKYDKTAIDEAADYLGVELCYIKYDGKAYIRWEDKEFDLLAVYATARADK